MFKKKFKEKDAFDSGIQARRMDYSVMPVVYICSPYRGYTAVNEENAKKYCRFAVKRGCIPFAPHLLYPQFLDDDNPDDRNIGVYAGLYFLTKCAELWVFGETISSGMSAEIRKAEKRHIPIRYFTEDCAEKSGKEDGKWKR